MPKFLEDKLRAEYGDNPHAIYGTMNKIGAMHGNKETAKGRAMEKKHEDKMKHSGHNLRRMEIEAHRDKSGNITGHTVHHYAMPAKKTSKSGAFTSYDSDHTAHPFGAGQHKEMMAHIAQHLGAAAEAEPDGDEGEEETEE